MSNFIWVTAEKDMIHKYSNAPDEVSFLRNEHRHNFKFKVFIEIFHNDRDMEFLLFQKFVKEIIFKLNRQAGNNSCEMMANHIHTFIIKKYPNRKIIIEVSEDGENGVIMNFL